MVQEYDWVLGFPPSCSIELHARWNIQYTVALSCMLDGTYNILGECRTLRGEREQANHSTQSLLEASLETAKGSRHASA